MPSQVRYGDWRPGGERTTLSGVTFDSTIPGGAGWAFSQVGPDHFRFRARAGLEPYAWRACFRIDTDRVGRAITLEVADFNHFGQELWQEQATVVSRDGDAWEDFDLPDITLVTRTPTGDPAGDDSIDDGWHPPYGVRYRLTLDAPTVWFASPPPYTLDHCARDLRALEQRTTFISVEQVARTHYADAHGFPMLMARLEKAGGERDKIRVLVVAGEHASETAGMYAAEGLLEEILRSHDLLADFSFLVVPVLNVDGAALGRTYHNVDPENPAAPGVNLARDWADRSQPETRALWQVIEGFRPHCVVNLHNGRHRLAHEVFAPPQRHLAPLMRRLREHLPLPVEWWRPDGDPRTLQSVVMTEGMADTAFCFEALLLSKVPGCGTRREGYRRTGMCLLRALVGALREVYDRPQMLALSEALGAGPVRLDARRFTTRLPWFYYAEYWSAPADAEVINLEVNGLPLLPGHYDVHLRLREGPEAVRVRRRGGRWEDCRARDGWALVPSLPVPGRMVDLEVQSADETLLQEALIAPEGTPLAVALERATPFDRYVRDTLAGEKPHLRADAWPRFHATLLREGFGAEDLAQMHDDLVDWIASRQVLDADSPYRGAVWSEEDKYDARDAAAAAACFARRHARTRDERWLKRARTARRYCYLSRRIEPGNPPHHGGFLHMVHGRWGVEFRRLEPPYPGIDGVDTCIIIQLLCRAAEEGLALNETACDVIRDAADWVARNEPLPGVFLHHEGATHDCQNSNALAVGALVRAFYALHDAGADPPQDWLHAAHRGLEHYVHGQEAIGVWPYVFAQVGRRGQAFSFENIPDHGIGLYHLTRVAHLTPPALEAGLPEALKRAARWYLCVSRLDGDTIDLEYDTRPDLGADICFSGFTWCRFTAAATLLRIARLTGEREPWAHLALRLMEHVRRKRWQTDDPARAPVISHARPEAMLATWCQAAEWDAVMLGEMMDDLEEMGGRW